MEKLEKISLKKGIVYKPSRVASVVVLENKKITISDSSDDVRHILLDVSQIGMNFYEGQSIGVIVNGVDKDGRAHKVRLYSVASCKNGEDGNGKVLALCVKREFAQIAGEIFQGVCSNYLCDRKRGDTITITGPVGRTFLLPTDISTNIIMFATGTGIAPYRGFLQAMQFMGGWQGKIFLFMGCKTQKEALYLNEVNSDLQQYHFLRYVCAFSRVQTNKEGGKMYIQHRLQECLEKIWNLLLENHFALYICGLRSMEKGLEEIFSKKAQQSGYDWKNLKMDWRKSGRWNIEVY